MFRSRRRNPSGKSSKYLRHWLSWHQHLLDRPTVDGTELMDIRCPRGKVSMDMRNHPHIRGRDKGTVGTRCCSPFSEHHERVFI